jgi:DNA gyrase subunit A
MAMNITEKTGKLVGMKEVDDNNDLMIMTKKGITIRMAISDLRVLGRVTQGVRLINLDDGDEIASIAKIVNIEGDEVIVDGEVNPESIIDATLNQLPGDEPTEVTPDEVPPVE